VSDQAIVDMFDRLDSARVKLRLRARRLWSTVATSKEGAAAERAREVSQSPPSTPDGDEHVPLGGYC